MTEPKYDATLLEGTYLLAFSYYEAEDWPNAVKWFEEVVERASKYENADFLLENARTQLKLATLYDQGQQALNTGDWSTARDWFQKVLDIDPGYKNADDLYNKAHKEIELPKLYEQALEQHNNQDWDGAIETLTKVRDLDPRYKEAHWLLEQAWQKKRLEEDYQRASKRCAKAETTKQEEDWREAAALLQKIADKEPGYKMVSAKLARAQRHLEYFELVRKGKENYARGEWQEAVRYLDQAIETGSWDSEVVDMLDETRELLRQQEVARHQKLLELYTRGSEYYHRRKWGQAVTYLEEASAIEPDYSDLPTKLREASKKLRQQRVIRITLGALNLIVLTLLVAIFADQLAAVGNDIAKWWSENRATATPTVAIPSIDRIEVWMNSGQLNLDQLPSLTSGEGVVLEVVVFDTNGKRYTSDDLMCKWSVAPLGDEDAGINTDLCKTLYTPSREYSNQTVRFELEGLGEQFEPGDPISMEFDIITE